MAHAVLGFYQLATLPFPIGVEDPNLTLSKGGMVEVCGVRPLRLLGLLAGPGWHVGVYQPPGSQKMPEIQ